MILPVWLRCPSCGHEWHAATLTDWNEIKPETIANRCYCKKCDAKPPMSIVGKPEQPGLFT